MKFLWWLLPLAAIAGGIVYLQQLRDAPPQVEFVKPTREQLVSAVSTNGRVEPLEYAAIRSESAGPVVRLAIDKGQQISKGALVAELDSSRARSDLASAEARIAQVKADLAVLNQGGSRRDITAINTAIDRAKLDLADAQRQVDSLARLVEKKAAPGVELTAAKQRVVTIQAEIQGLEQKRATLVTEPDRAGADARLKEAEAAAALARKQIDQSVIRAPQSGTVYQLDIRPGAYLQPGDLIGYVGRLDRVRVVVYVDEPELGGIRTGQAVTVTWDALQGREWTGVVDKLPTQIVALGSRQVGEVLAIIDNPGQLLLPQTNINAQIRTNVAANALTIPKETLRRDNGQTGVFVLGADQTVRWQPVKLGAASVTRLQVVEGLDGNSPIALPTDVALQNGMRVTPVVQSR